MNLGINIAQVQKEKKMNFFKGDDVCNKTPHEKYI